MSAVRNWLEAIGLGRYADAFEANDIDMELLRKVDDQTLKDNDNFWAGPILIDPRNPFSSFLSFGSFYTTRVRNGTPRTRCPRSLSLTL